MMECVPEGCGEPHHQAPRLRAAATVARIVPSLWAVLLIAMIGVGGGACGKSIFATATPTPTNTPTPGTGAFLYVSNNDGTVGEFRRNITSGAPTFLGTVAAGPSSGPFGITASAVDNFVYVANSGGAGSIREFSINLVSGKLAVIGSGAIAAGNSPRWITVDPSGTFAFATNFGGATISAYNIDTSNGVLSSNGTAGGPLANPYAAIANSSFLFVSDRANSGTIVTYPINTDGSLGIPTPTNMVFSGTGMPGPVIIDPTGAFLYVTDVVNGTVSLLNGVSSGTLTLVQVYPTNSPGTPAIGIAIAAPVGGNEFLYVANQSANTISGYTVTPSTGALTLPGVSVSGLNAPTGLAVDPSSSFLYVTNQSTGTLSTYAINASTGALTAVGTPVQTEASNPNSKPMFISIAD
jgi:6-phosphogluconolactonase (cycloisomerase 2 family)